MAGLIFLWNQPAAAVLGTIFGIEVGGRLRPKAATRVRAAHVVAGLRPMAAARRWPASVGRVLRVPAAGD